MSYYYNKSIDIILFLMRRSRKDREALKYRETRFVNHWNIGETMKYYEPLEDEYSSFYFAKGNVRKHLQSFNRAVKKEPKTVDLLRITHLVSTKYRNLGKQSSLDKSKQPDKDSINESFIKPYQQTLKPKSLQKLKKFGKLKMSEDGQSNNKKLNRAESYDDRLPEVKKARVYKSYNRQLEPELEPKNKKIFIDYLNKKKENLSKKQ